MEHVRARRAVAQYAETSFLAGTIDCGASDTAMIDREVTHVAWSVNWSLLWRAAWC